MFRTLALVSVLLMGCKGQASTETRIVKIFENVPSIKTKMSNHNNCNWASVEVSIFNQANQRIKFEYLACPEDGKGIQFEVKNGSEIFAVTSDEEDLHLFSVWKTGPYTEQEFIESLISKDARDKCIAIQNENSDWKIGLSEADDSFGSGWVMYPPLSESQPIYSDTNGVCGKYGFNPGNDWVFGVKGGIGIGYSELMNILAFYDLHSITYDTRG